ncbi:cotranscriptional regulator ARB2A-like [Argopecten irradians]|uniref:cotranscriptional regulator ARB2A-like n=1 Tax=Argopecten irradians TaxID=31199 RepID=UPI003723D0F0
MFCISRLSKLHFSAFTACLLIVKAQSVSCVSMGNLLKGMSTKKGKDYNFPDTLAEFGYGFNDEGQLRHLETDEAYQFQVRENDLEYNQRRYEALGEVITNMVYSMMEKDAGLERVSLPVSLSLD